MEPSIWQRAPCPVTQLMLYTVVSTWSVVTYGLMDRGEWGHGVRFWGELWRSVMVPTESPSVELGGPLEPSGIIPFHR